MAAAPPHSVAFAADAPGAHFDVKSLYAVIALLSGSRIVPPDARFVYLMVLFVYVKDSFAAKPSRAKLPLSSSNSKPFEVC